MFLLLQKIDDYFETGNELLEYHKDILNDPYRKKLREVNLDIERLGLSDKQVTAVEYFDLNDIAIWIYDAKNSMADGFRKDWERDIDSVSDYDLLVSNVVYNFLFCDRSLVLVGCTCCRTCRDSFGHDYDQHYLQTSSKTNTS